MNIQELNFDRSWEAVLATGVHEATSDQERARALSVIAYGFIRDPIARWFWPAADTYARAMPAFVDAFSSRALKHGTADLTSCGGAAAFWLPPGILPDDDAITAVLDSSIPENRWGEIEEFFDQMASFHPEEACWYLPQIAADPAYQGQGLGAALMQHRLDIIDALGEPAYLESSNISNIAFYRRHGFEVMGEIQAGTSPKMIPMFRKGQRKGILYRRETAPVPKIGPFQVEAGDWLR